jgi:hypothetical protein
LTPSSPRLDKSPFVRLIADGIDHIGNRITAETDAKLAETNARIDRLELLVLREAHYQDLAEHELFKPALEVMATGDEGLFWQWCEDHSVPRPAALRLLARFNAAWQR